MLLSPCTDSICQSDQVYNTLCHGINVSRNRSRVRKPKEALWEEKGRYVQYMLSAELHTFNKLYLPNLASLFVESLIMGNTLIDHVLQTISFFQGIFHNKSAICIPRVRANYENTCRYSQHFLRLPKTYFWNVWEKKFMKASKYLYSLLYWCWTLLVCLRF